MNRKLTLEEQRQILEQTEKVMAMFIKMYPDEITEKDFNGKNVYEVMIKFLESKVSEN